ncbi:MAG: hypothetical protein DMF56_03955 [Acidobacteria bacterium]|nr:MAG: hypothetical protein DMF56_03955 [Acidobacteriota bacterium]
MMRRPALAVLFACAIWFSGHEYVQLVRDSLALLPLRYEERRERVLGGDYVVMQRLASEIPRDASVTIVLRRPRDIDRGIFLNYYLYPRATHFTEPSRCGAGFPTCPPGGRLESLPHTMTRTGVIVLVDGSDMRVISR